MKVIIPLAGFGTRLRPHTYTKPKPLINVAGKPVLGHLLDKLQGLDIDEYIFIVGYLGEQVEEYVKSEYQLKNVHFVEQKELLGQAHAIWLAREYLDDSPAFILFVDTLFETDLTTLGKSDADAVIFVKEVEDPRSFGVVTLDKDEYITGFVEKPKVMDNRLAVVGLYYFKNGNKLIEAIRKLIFETQKKTQNEFFLADAMDIMVKEGDKFRIQQVSVWLDCGKPDTVLETNRYLLDNSRDNSTTLQIPADVIIVPPVNIHPSAQLTCSVIGPHVTIGANCVISGSIMRDTIIDEGSVCKDTLLEQSLIGRNARVEGRYRTVNVGDSSAVGFVS
jgi:glucose-1-phosphate thymidylyltransferase